MSISMELRELAQQEAQIMLDSLTGVVAVIVATEDGFDVASATFTDIDPARIAAMASSISAIGAVVSQEASLGRSKTVTVNTDDGFALFSAVYRDDVVLVVNVIANPSAILAQVLHRCGECVRRLSAVSTPQYASFS
jgi:uncharacterized protein